MGMLKVPISLQGNKPYCGLHSAKMVLEYYQCELTEDQILEQVGEDMDETNGIEITALGTFVIKQGFHVVLNYFPNFLPMELLYAGDEALRGWTDSDSDDAVIRKRKAELSAFMDSGGKVFPYPVDFNNVVKEIEVGKRPVILNVDSAPLYGVKERGRGHFVVAIGTERGEGPIAPASIIINDPNYAETRTYDLYQIMHACYSWKSAVMFITRA